MEGESFDSDLAAEKSWQEMVNNADQGPEESDSYEVVIDAEKLPQDFDQILDQAVAQEEDIEQKVDDNKSGGEEDGADAEVYAEAKADVEVNQEEDIEQKLDEYRRKAGEKKDDRVPQMPQKDSVEPMTDAAVHSVFQSDTQNNRNETKHTVEKNGIYMHRST